MAGYLTLANSLYAGAAVVGSYGLYKAKNACKAYFSAENYEDKYLNAAKEAFNEIKGMIRGRGITDEMIDLEWPDFSSVENVIKFFHDCGNPLDEAAVNKFKGALETYQTNIDQFQKYSAHLPEENLLSVKTDLAEERGDPEKLSVRARHFESRIISEGLSKDDSCEEGAYARVLDTRKQLLLALRIAKPGVQITSSTVDEYLSNFNQAELDPALAPIVSNRADAYQAALSQHKIATDLWRGEQTKSSRILLSTIKSEAEGSENLQLRGRVEYLERRVKSLDEHVVGKFNTCFEGYQQKINETLNQLRERLEVIDPGLVGKSRWGSSGWNLFSWIANFISSLWNKNTVMDLNGKCHLLETELAKPKPTTEDAHRAWMSSEPLTGINPQKQAEIGGLRDTFTREATPHIQSGETLAQVAVRKDHDKEQLLRMQYNKLKADSPELRDKTGETFTFYEDGSLNVKGAGFSVYIGGDLPKEYFKADIFMKMIMGGGDAEICDYIRNTMFSHNITAFIKWDNGESEVFYKKPQEGTVPEGGVVEGGNKDFEHSKFITGRSIKYKLDEETGLVEIDGEGIRLGLSMQDYSKALAGFPEGFLKNTITGTLNRLYRNGMKLTLNLKKIGSAVDRRDGRTKVRAFYEFNEENPVELQRGSVPNGLIKGQIPNPLELFVDKEEFEQTFNQLEWT